MVRAVTPIPFVKARFFDRCGKPLAGGKVYTYEANTTTPKVTYKDPYGLTPNTNPIILDAAGEADIYLDGTYRIRITDRNDVLVNDVAKIGSWFSDNLQDTLDNISGAMDDALKPMLQNLDDAINTAAAAGAGANGWDANLVVYGETTQKQINDGLESIAQLLAIENPRNGMRVYVKSYYVGLGKGGGTFIYDASKANVNDGGTCINGWVRQITQAEILATWFGAKGDGTTDDTDAIQKAVNACNALNKPLHIPKGEGLGLYLITKAINITQSISISGDGYNYCGLRCDGCDGFVVAKGVSFVTVKDMTILQIPRYTDATKNNFTAIKINGESGSENYWGTYQNLFIDGFGTAIQGSFFWSHVFSNVISVYCGNGIIATGKSVNNFVNNCQLGGSSSTDTVGIGLYANGAATEGWVITNNLIFNFNTAIEAVFCSHVIVSANILDFCKKNGILILDEATGGSLNWRVSENYIAISGEGSFGILARNNHNDGAWQNRGHTFTDNDILYYEGSSLLYGISTQGTAEHGTYINGNRVRASATACDISTSAKNVVVTNNNWFSGYFYSDNPNKVHYHGNQGIVQSSVVFLYQNNGKSSFYYNNTPPTVTEEHKIGDIVWNIAPNTGNHVGWVLTVGRVFKPFGMIS